MVTLVYLITDEDSFYQRKTLLRYLILRKCLEFIDVRTPSPASREHFPCKLFYVSFE